MKSILSPKLLLAARVAALLLFTMPAILCAHGQTYQDSFQAARALLNLKRYSEAFQQAKRANALDSSQWGAYYVAGTALVGLQRQGEAITFFQAALARAPEQARPIINSAIASCRQITANENQTPPPATQVPPPSARVAAGPLDLTVPYASAQQPEPARPQFYQGQTTTVGNCYESHAGFGFRVKPGTVTLGPNFEWQEPSNPSHNYSVPVEQVSKFYPNLTTSSKQNKIELEQEKRIDVSGYTEELNTSIGEGGVSFSFSINGKSKNLWCGRNEFVEIFRYFQAHGFYQDVAIIQ